MDMENPNADTFLALFCPTACAIVDTIVDIENPNADTLLTLFFFQFVSLLSQ